MSSSLKRKGSPTIDASEESSKRRFAEATEGAKSDNDNATESQKEPQSTDLEADETISTAGSSTAATTTTADPVTDRLARFAALRARNQASRKSNLHETKHEAKRASTDLSQLSSLNRKKEIAAHKLLKAEIEDGGEDFERKRAWDWTIEESERWDARKAEKANNRDKNAFADWSQEAEKIYSRQVGSLEKNGGMDERRSAYEAEKSAAIKRAVQSGGLELVETKNGELIAVDRDGTFYSTADQQTTFAGNSSKPSRAAVDRLVDDIKKAEEVRLKKRRDRGRADDNGGDITFINEKNKQFNLKLARFYNKYTADIRESFERGTAI
ncbi:SYF2-domain-containing protein [Dissoconium aciculare CBS 342.82]|uniref:Pre-mRNA-splicing factor SYF2 n=1 Tax=Dissoconium aciculare CBS 342.82 TaxID=1314786 RepID=A0A6J3M4M6_9PEZI|nr:SYF2-domain-containing protein [Dissoconium aciculare CBS 342.82]KAF1822439.1 SYF2-domain-containing protein [Dissoconium aciculare CBS 342.82]